MLMCLCRVCSCRDFEAFWWLFFFFFFVQVFAGGDLSEEGIRDGRCSQVGCPVFIL